MTMFDTVKASGDSTAIRCFPEPGYSSSLAGIGGVPKSILYDNIKIAIAKIRGRWFEKFCAAISPREWTDAAAV